MLFKRKDKNVEGFVGQNNENEDTQEDSVSLNTYLVVGTAGWAGQNVVEAESEDDAVLVCAELIGLDIDTPLTDKKGNTVAECAVIELPRKKVDFDALKDRRKARAEA